MESNTDIEQDMYVAKNRVLHILWESLAKKGKLATVVGFLIIIAAVFNPLIKHNKGITFTEAYMWQIIYFLIAGIVLVILPSNIEISKSGLKIQD